jgi:molybdate-binding protein/DNA-binding XRE family transcriptional regulator
VGRLAVGLSQQELAERVGVSRQSLAAVEAGLAVPSTSVALRLSLVLGCSVEALFRLANQPSVDRAWLPAAEGRIKQGTRVQLSEIGGRLLAWPLEAVTALGTLADGIVTGSAGARQVTIERFGGLDMLAKTIVVAGCDPALGLLAARLNQGRRDGGYRVLWRPMNSRAALKALARGECHIAGSHLPDSGGEGFNLTAVRRALPNRAVRLITLSVWQEGLIVTAGNPWAIRQPADLAKPGLAIVNREPGAGSRLALDKRLRAAGVRPGQVCGYDQMARSHAAVAEAVASGRADAGPGILSVARAYQLGFVPLLEERFDLVIPDEFLDLPPVQALLNVTVSAAWRREMDALGGYDCSMTGMVAARLPA